MIKKISETTPTQASIIDWYSTSSQDGYSCDYVNIINTYDGDEGEMFTGKTWIDGSKIYRKVYQINSASYFGDTTGIDNVVDITGMIYRNNGNDYMLGAYNGTYYSSVNIDRQTYNKFQLTTNLTNISKVVIIIEYTKTTN